MIKCNVTVIGTVSREGRMMTDNSGSSFIAFGLQTVLQAKSGINKTLDISVALDPQQHQAFDFAPGTRVRIKGVLTFRKRENILYHNLSANKVEFGISEQDSISGTMSFRGTLGSKEILEKQGKKGSYRIFDAFSSEKVSESNYSYTWVHFIDFTAERPQWLVTKVGIDAEAELELSVFNDRETLACRITSLSLWNKNTTNQ